MKTKGAGAQLRLLAVLWLAAVLSGCGKKETPPAEGETAYQIYYLNSAMTKLSGQEYRTATVDTDILIGELMEQFRSVPADVDCQVSLSEKVEYQGCRREEQVLYLYFDTNYTSMKPEREILCRAALAQTFTQVPGVEFININSGSQPLTDRNGMPVGMLSGSEFIDSISDVNAYDEAELTLYFANETGDLLAPEKRRVIYSLSASLEQVVVEELISGPETAGLKATLDPATQVLSVSVNENVCFINLDAAFLNSTADVSEAVPIYSIVNSLSELSTVNRVQFSVNGEQNVMFRDSISLSDTFERNLDYIQQQ